jgi:D-alanine-D-alanine ligase
MFEVRKGMIHVDQDWWKSLFDEVYLITDARFVCNPALTRQEVALVEQTLRLRKSDRILDLCGGQGRHALELARRGYQHLTVLDYADFLLQRGRQEAVAARLAVTFYQGDARATLLPAASFDVILLMVNSFGYFADAADDQRVLAEAARLLTRGGRFLIDLIDRDVALRQFRPESWHEATDDFVVCWKRQLVHDVIRVREVVLSKTTGLLRDRTYAERLYSPEHLCALLAEVGFVDAQVRPSSLCHSPADGTDHGLATNRMLITALKG